MITTFLQVLLVVIYNSTYEYECIYNFTHELQLDSMSSTWRTKVFGNAVHRYNKYATHNAQNYVFFWILYFEKMTQ